MTDTPPADSASAPSIDSATRRRLRRIAHHLDPIILLGDAGATEGVIAETQRALSDHELIKVRVAAMDRADRKQVIQQLAAACAATVVQEIGRVAVLYRANPKAEPRLSNVVRFT